MTDQADADTAKLVQAHCARAAEFDQEALTVEGLLENAPNEEARETLQVISDSWRQLAELHRRLQKQWR